MDLVTDIKSVTKDGQTVSGIDFHQYSKKSHFDSIDDLKQACRDLLDKGVEHVIVTLGKKGSLLVNKNT